MIFEKEGSLYYQFDNETVRVDAWGKNAVRFMLICTAAKMNPLERLQMGK